MSDFVMTIGGESVPAGESFGVLNPATGEVFAHAPECSRTQLDAAFDSAAKAYRDWKTDEDLRRATLQKMADVLLASAGDIAPVLTAEQGKPLGDSNIEVLAAAIWCQYFANLETPSQTIQDDADALVNVVRRPLGVVAAITPWNFPLTLAFWKIAPALLAGNTMVLKPSPFTPLSTLKAVELLRSVVPPGVLNVVSGGDDLAEVIAPADHVQHSGWDNGTQQLHRLQRGQGSERRWLEHHGVAGQKSRGDLPEGEGQGEVPRGDGRHHAEWTPDHVDQGIGIVLDGLRWSLEVGEVLAPDGSGKDFV